MIKRLLHSPADLRLFLAAVLAAGFSASIFDAIFNNYLDFSYNITSFQRAALEIPRELPGLIIAGVIAVMFVFCARRMAAIAMFLMSTGLIALSFLSPCYKVMVIWLFIFSLGQHLFIPLNSTIGMELASEGRPGKRLGQLNGIRNCAAILGSFSMFLAFKYLHIRFQTAFITAAAGFAGAGVLLLFMKKGETHPPAVHLKLYRRYYLFYWLSILYGTRKQIFLTFAPWVLVTVFKQPTQTIATLLTVGGAVGILFQPFLGRAIDRFGERVILAGEAVVLVIICLAYGFSARLFGMRAALVIICACYVTDHLLLSVGMARATYMKKIAAEPAHIAPALALSTSIDHVFSISTAVLCGLLWRRWGYEPVFVLGACIAVVNFFSAMKIRVLPAA